MPRLRLSRLAAGTRKPPLRSVRRQVDRARRQCDCTHAARESTQTAELVPTAHSVLARYRRSRTGPRLVTVTVARASRELRAAGRRRLLVRRRDGHAGLPVHLASPVAIEEREAHLFACRIWPGPICGSCWAASCACGYVFETVADARTRWPNGRLCCSSCAERARE